LPFQNKWPYTSFKNTSPYEAIGHNVFNIKALKNDETRKIIANQITQDLNNNQLSDYLKEGRLILISKNWKQDEDLM